MSLVNDDPDKWPARLIIGGIIFLLVGLLMWLFKTPLAAFLSVILVGAFGMVAGLLIIYAKSRPQQQENQKSFQIYKSNI